MAVEFGDLTSGFRHTEVIRFINNEVLMNGGGPEFYMTFRSRPWNEIEDQLYTILVDPKVPRSLKRACTWSALALSVRVGARQREQQARRIGRLQDQVGERESASWTLASELQRLREERDQAAAQLASTQTALQEAMDEREILRGRLLQAERSALAVVPEPRTEQCASTGWSLEEEDHQEMRSREARNTPHLDTQMPKPPILSYVPGIPWVQAVHPFIRMPVPHILQLNTPLPLAFPYSTPVPCPVVTESRAPAAAMATVVPQMTPAGIYPPRLWVALRSQEAMSSSWGQIYCRQNESSEILQDVNHLEDSLSYSEEGPEKSWGATLHGDSIKSNHKESLDKPQVMVATEKKNLAMYQETAALEVNTNHNIMVVSGMPQEMSAEEDKTRCTQKKHPGIPRKVVGMGDCIHCNTEEVSITPQETATQVNKTSPILKKYPGILLRKPDLGNIISCKQKEDLKTNQGAVFLGEGLRNCQRDDTITFQQMTILDTGENSNEKKVQILTQEIGRSQNQKEEPNKFQSSPLGKSKYYFVNKCPPKQLPPKQKSKQHQGMKVFESKQLQGTKSSETKQQEKKPLSHHTPMNLVCPSCKAMNRSWCKGCYKCGKECVQFERKDVDPQQTQ
ncbi:testis-expressed protein 13C-1-like [Psammomys obesus]|uniref:testis-expressed protein 13C-1-like n=1 Tax=Psammomys obesus TaxID=48139 RepID=UPI0024534AB9|nr:testis-expressed protein 13C-1-like [Psammomys obesus]